MNGSTTISDEPNVVECYLVSHTAHVGAVRRENQDAAWSASRPSRAFLLVADGMGGHEGGAEASSTARELIGSLIDQSCDDAGLDVPELFAKVARRVAAEAPDGGTTLVLAALTPDRMDVWHVGDSRAYLLREGTLVQLTTDHSWVQTLVASGKLTADEAAKHPGRNVLLRAIGKERDSNPDHSSLRFLASDVLLLCSDGLHGVVPESEIASLLEAHRSSPNLMVNELVRAALRYGAPDNIGIAVAVAHPPKQIANTQKRV